MADNHPIKIYINETENRITFKPDPSWFPEIAGNHKNGGKFHKSHQILNQTKRNINGQRISLDINISTKYVYVRKHTQNKNEKATEIIFCACNGN